MLCGRFMNIEYLDVAGQCIQALEKVYRVSSRHVPIPKPGLNLNLVREKPMQAWATEHNIDLSLPGNAYLISQLFPLWQSKMAANPSHPGGHSHLLSQYTAPLHFAPGLLVEDEKMVGLTERLSSGQVLSQITPPQSSFPANQLPDCIIPNAQTIFQDGEDYKSIQECSSENPVTKINPTPNGEFLVASDTQPPQFKVFELGNNLSPKFQKDMHSEMTEFQILSDDHLKLAILCADRSVFVHANCGSHYIFRIPRIRKAITYDRSSCELLCTASYPDLYIIQLEQGTLSALRTQSPTLNVARQSKLHQLIACEDGGVECFDQRTKHPSNRLNIAVHAGDNSHLILQDTAQLPYMHKQERSADKETNEKKRWLRSP